MFSRLWTAFGRVADAVNSLADSLFGLARTFQQADAHFRDRLGMEALPLPLGENVLPAIPTATLAGGVPDQTAQPEPSGKNGRKRTAAT